MSPLWAIGYRRRRKQLQEEIESHLSMAIADRMARGEPEEAARQAALREFGNVPLVEEVTRKMWGWTKLERLVQDFLYVLRQTRRSPGFAAAAIGTLALGLGAAAAMFTVVDHVLLRPTRYQDPGRLVVIRESGGKTPGEAWDVPWLDIEQWQKQSRSFAQIAFWNGMRGQDYLVKKTAAFRVAGYEVSSNLFETLGVAPALGRGLVPETPSFTAGKNAGTIVLSDAIWKEAFDGDRQILGKVVRINDASYTVVGVMPPGFDYPQGAFANRAAQVWTPIQLGDHDKTRDSDYNVVARLRPGVRLAAAAAEMAVVQKHVAAMYTDPETRELRSVASIERYGDSLVGADVKKALLALLAAAGVLWLIASVNVTNLLLARGTARQREIAMRRALGASGWRIVQQMMVEGVMLSAAAAVLGTGLALGSVKLMARELSQRLPLPAPATPDVWILLALLGLTVASAMLSTAWPALLAVRAPIEPALKQGGIQAGTGPSHHRLRGTLVSAEVAMSLTLLVACGLLLRTIYTLRRVPLGYHTDHIVVTHLAIPSYRFTGQNVVQVLYQPLLQRTQHLHGVQSAGLMSEVPLGHTFNAMLTLLMNGNNISATLKMVSPDIQRVFGFKMLAGRFYNGQDLPTSAPVVVVNPAFAREFAPNKHDPASVLGIKVWNLRKNAPMHVIGVMDNERQSTIAEPSQPEVEVCLCQITPDAGAYQASTIAMDLAVRTERPAAEMIPELRGILRTASPELANSSITTMDQIVEDSYGSQRLAAHLLEIFGGSALLLCVTGLYGLLAYVVSQRTRELGVRIALGAPRGSLLWLMMRQAGLMLLIGVAVGTGFALTLGRLARGFLYGVSAHDGWTLTGAAALLLASGLVAAYLPARRAARVNPMEALRAE